MNPLEASRFLHKFDLKLHQIFTQVLLVDKGATALKLESLTDETASSVDWALQSQKETEIEI